MKKNILTSVLTAFLPVTIIYSQTPINIPELISGADLYYDKPVSRSEEGMPVGNGRMGSLVWTTPSSLKFQINRVDIFGNNAASNSFFERNTDYCSGAGFVDIDFVTWGEEVFSQPGFIQHLSCFDGVVTTNGNKISTKTIVWNEQDVMAVKIEDLRDVPQAIIINLRMLRDTVVKRGSHTATSRLKIIDKQIVLTQRFEEEDYYCGSAVLIGVSGRESRTRFAGNTELQLIVKPGNEPFTVYISSAATFDKKKDLISVSTEQLNAAIPDGFENILSSNRKWWSSFWGKSYIRLHSDDGEADFVENNYNYFMYVMASSSLGAFPPKFNGMIWTTGGDTRKWGNNYWGANQSCMYNGLFPANRIELMEPMFRMYTAMSASLETAARQQWGSKGIYIPETVAFDGLPELPENIADEMQDLYLVKKPWSEKSMAFDEYASTKSPFQSRWNWKQDKGWKDGKWTFTDKGAQTFGHVSHIFSRGAKIAYQYWQRYEFTRDIEWLRSTGYPILKGVAEFYRNFPNVRKEPDGKYHIYNVNDNESVRGGHNTVEEISSMMGIFPAAVHASEVLNVDSELRLKWKEFVQNLSPLPLNTDYPETYKQGTPVTFVRSLPPVVQGPASGRPDGNTMPVWFFDLCNPVAGNTEMVKIANATFDSYFPGGINKNTPVYVLSKLAVTGTMMERKDATRYLIPNQIRTAEIETMPNRMTLREGYQTTGVQNLGRMSDALHYALINSSPPGPGKDPVVSLFPAWPEEWDADFKLLCRGNFLVESSFRDGKIVFLELLSQSGSACRIINPWTNSKVLLYRNGKKSERLSGNLLKFDTRSGERIKIIPG
ncbi:MAG: glycoside hydrolase [Bacteroidetes bacterium RBG_13_43_22]|nr:MAG: glycoside hydrolase [Bacteroidetes bacterium RBG_13_43_22]OFY72793.1 MAG: glycoside hydrolase [Bacteroidetes bacterium RBG_19FT_COMBO_42_7]